MERNTAKKQRYSEQDGEFPPKEVQMSLNE